MRVRVARDHGAPAVGGRVGEEARDLDEVIPGSRRRKRSANRVGEAIARIREQVWPVDQALRAVVVRQAPEAAADLLLAAEADRPAIGGAFDWRLTREAQEIGKVSVLDRHGQPVGHDEANIPGAVLEAAGLEHRVRQVFEVHGDRLDIGVDSGLVAERRELLADRGFEWPEAADGDAEDGPGHASSAGSARSERLST